MQHKTQIASSGIWPALRRTVLGVANKPGHRKEVVALLTSAEPHVRLAIIGGKMEKVVSTREEAFEGILRTLSRIAVEPLGEININCTPRTFLDRCLVVAPKLTRDVLAAAQKFAFKNSKSRRIMRFMFTSGRIKYQTDRRPLSVWELQDQEISRGYEAASGEQVSVADVTQARRELAKEISRGRKMRIRC